MRGTVKWFNEGKGYGFITDDTDGEDVFLHASAVEGDSYPADGQKVEYQREQGKKGLKATTARLLVALLAVGLLILGGCSEGNLRFAPSEEQKQNAQIAASLAGKAHQDGLPPGSKATARLAEAAATDAIYAGPPKQPVNISELTPPAVTGAWSNKDKQVEALKLKNQLKDKGQAIATRQMADLAEQLQNKTKVAAKDLVQRVQAFVDAGAAIAEVADSIPVPDAPQLTAEEKARMAALDAAISKINSAAAAQATARPTASDVIDEATRQADRWATFAENALPWLAAIPGAGLVLGGIHGVRKARLTQKELDAAYETQESQKATAATAEARAASLERSLATVVRQVDAIKGSPVGQVDIDVNGQKITAADFMKAMLSGQDAQTAADVAAVRNQPSAAAPTA